MADIRNHGTMMGEKAIAARIQLAREHLDRLRAILKESSCWVSVFAYFPVAMQKAYSVALALTSSVYAMTAAGHFRNHADSTAHDFQSGRGDGTF